MNRHLNFSIGLMLSALLLPQLSDAQEPLRNFYVQLDGGASIFSQGETNDGEDADFDAGFTVGGRLGIRLSPSLRAEADVGYSLNDVAEIDGEDVSDTNLEFNALTFGGALFYDLSGLRGVKPYVGAGLGAVYKVVEADGADDDEETDLTANGEIGFSYDITPAIALVPHYRLIWFDDVGDGEQLAHWLRLGVRFTP